MLFTQSKTQVTIEYKKDTDGTGAVIPVRVDTVVISTQHAEEITTEDLRSELLEKVVKSVIPANLLDQDTVYHMQPSGRFVIGGPQGDAGLTGRKIIVDSYGGWGAHGGGAFSGGLTQPLEITKGYKLLIVYFIVQAKIGLRSIDPEHTLHDGSPSPFLLLVSLAEH